MPPRTPPAVVQPVDLRVGVIPFGMDATDERRHSIPTDMRRLGLFRSVEASDPADAAPGARFDILIDLRGMGLTGGRVADVDAAGTGKRLYTWQPVCGWNDTWCINPENIARDVAWLFAKGTALSAQLAAEMKKAAAQQPSEAASTEETSEPSPAPAAQKAWWDSGSKP